LDLGAGPGELALGSWHGAGLGELALVAGVGGGVGAGAWALNKLIWASFMEWLVVVGNGVDS